MAVMKFMIGRCAPWKPVPCLRVPAREKKLLLNSAFRNVNYDHALLGLREGMQLFP
jgi:hypothetical protein